MYNHLLYLFFWGGNILVLLILSAIFPHSIVLGNYRFDALESAIYAGFWATVLFWGMWDYVLARKVRLAKLNGRFLVFWAFNFVAFWLVSRFSHIAGFGIESFKWVLLISLLANVIQRLLWTMVVRGSARRLAF